MRCRSPPPLLLSLLSSEPSIDAYTYAGGAGGGRRERALESEEEVPVESDSSSTSVNDFSPPILEALPPNTDDFGEADGVALSCCVACSLLVA